MFDLPHQDGRPIGCNEHEDVGENEGKGGDLEEREYFISLWAASFNN